MLGPIPVTVVDVAGRLVRGTVVGIAAALCLGPALAGGPATGSGHGEMHPAAPVAAPVLVPLVGGSPPPGPVVPGQAVAAAQQATTGASTAPSGASAPTPGASTTPPSGPGPTSPVGVGDRLNPALVAGAIGPLLRGGALGAGPSAASIVDVATGEVLYAEESDDALTPASTMKLVTAASVLDALGPDEVLRTRSVLLDPAATMPRIVLVGAGDPSLVSRPREVGGDGTSLRPAALSDLARATARSLRSRGIDEVSVGYDPSLFTGPAMHPTWDPAFPAGGVVAPVSALTVDEGRRTPTSLARVARPAEEAAVAFAALLEDYGIAVSGRPERVAERPESLPLASVSSPPIARLVERMIATSDNDYAESLARLGAGAAGHPASFEGVSKRGAEVLVELGIGAPDEVVADGSGLSRANALTPGTLTDLLRLTTPILATIGSGMPVGAATGSLRDRFDTDSTEAAAGLVRAKTGTLTGVVGLSGYLSRPDGRLLAFAILDDTLAGGVIGGRQAIDRALAELVECDCAGS